MIAILLILGGAVFGVLGGVHAIYTMLDLHDPRKILANLDHILRPETERERHGVVNHVAFPEGAVVFGEDLYVYYGSGDQGICVATCDYNELLEHLTSLI